jgi:hypothetical protein
VPCTTFAFPNGEYNTELSQYALLCGARTAMTTDPMWVNSRSALWQLPRVQLFGNASRARIEAKIALAAFKGALANPSSSGRRPSMAMPEAQPVKVEKGARAERSESCAA